MVRRLLVDLGIETLVIVDDEWESASTPAVEDVIGAVRAALAVEDSPERTRVVAALDELGLSAFGPWDESLRSRWADGDDTARRTLAAQLVGPLDDSSGPITAALGAIASWFGEDGPKLVQFTPEQWATEGKSFLDGAKGSVICLFDEELRMGRKGTSLMVAALAEKRPEDRIFFGLLTGTIERSSEESKTEILQRQVSSDRVIAFAKDRTTEPAAFADRLRIVVQATYHDGLRAMAHAAMADALQTVKDRLDGLTVADFDRIVVETARREGTWEGDELLRLVGIWERNERRTRMLANRGHMDQLLARIRVARPGAARVEPASERVRELRRLELYASDDVNAALLPIELGDVFVHADQAYVLLVQPCDTMVRKEGTRARDPRLAALASLARTEGSSLPGPSDAFYHLEYYEPTAGTETYIDFRRVAFLPLSVLDLVSFRIDGEAAIDPTADPPAEAFAPLRERYKALSKVFRVVLEDVAAAEVLDAEEKVAATVDTTSTGGGRKRDKPRTSAAVETEASRLQRLAWALYQGDATLKLTPTVVAGTQLRFGLRRVGRILQPHATTALVRFHQYRSRPAFEADFAREFST